MTATARISAAAARTRTSSAIIEPEKRAIFGRSYADEPDALVKQLAEDEAIAEADTLLLTVPNQLGVDYNAHVHRGDPEARGACAGLALTLALPEAKASDQPRYRAPAPRTTLAISARASPMSFSSWSFMERRSAIAPCSTRQVK